MSMDISSVRAGWDVYGSDNEKIGDVGDVGSNYLMVIKGFLFTKDIYIPTSAVTSIDQDRVYLNVAKDQIDTMGWDQAPAGDTGYATTGTAAGTYTDQDSTSVRSATTTTDAGYVAQPSQDYTTTERSTQTSDVDDDIRVRRHEEELQAHTVERQAGEVRVSKDVVEEQQTLEVPVTREQVTIRSTDVSGTVGDTSRAFQEGTISVPVREEDVEVNKQVRVAEELEIDKTEVRDTERVTDTVRKERVNVEEVGDVDVEGGTGTTRRT